MLDIGVKIEGTSPLLMHRFSDKSEVKLGSSMTATMKGQAKSPREQAEEAAYRDEKGWLFLPGPNVMASVISAGRFIKAGKRQLTTGATSLVTGGLSIKEIVLPFGTKDFEVDARSVVNQAVRARVMCYRPRLDKWSLAFTLEVDDTFFSIDIVRQLIDEAGKKIGLGAFRPEKKGPFGRFHVVEWRVAKLAKAA
jgi:hypothetical protein